MRPYWYVQYNAMSVWKRLYNDKWSKMRWWWIWMRRIIRILEHSRLKSPQKISWELSERHLRTKNPRHFPYIICMNVMYFWIFFVGNCVSAICGGKVPVYGPNWKYTVLCETLCNFKYQCYWDTIRNHFSCGISKYTFCISSLT